MPDEQMSDQQEGGQDGQVSGLSRVLNKETLIPAAATALTAAAAGFAAKKAPDLLGRLTGQAREGAQELGKEGAEGAKQAVQDSPLATVAGAASKLVPGKGKGKGGKKKTRRLPIQRWTDVAVPVDEAFARWRNFEDFPKFMHRVLAIKQEGDDTVEWQEKIWFSKRQWRGEITDLRENDRIAWKTVTGTSHSGVVSFHRLDDNLTRVLVTVDFQPAGMIEKLGSGLRFAKRAVEADLARFKAYAELGEAEGLEYEVAPQQDQKEDAEGDEREAEARRDGDEPSGRADSQGSNGSQSDEERDAGRREREERRKERREAPAGSR